MPRGTIPDALFWDTGTPYYYLRLIDGEGDRDRVILGGGDHRTGQVTDTKACYDEVEQMLRRLVPGVDVTSRWSGQVIETHDGLPYIGETAERQFVATGFSGNGMTFGTLAAMMACDAATGRTNPWKELFDVGRTKRQRAALWDYVKENADYPYYMVRDRFVGAGRQVTARREERRRQGHRDRRRACGRIQRRRGQRHRSCQPCARTWAAWWPGIRPKGRGTARATARAFTAHGEVMAGPAEKRLKAIELGKEHATPDRST